MELIFEVNRIYRKGHPNGDSTGKCVMVELEAKHDYTYFTSTMFLKLRPEDVADIKLRQKFTLTAVEEKP